MIKSSSDSFVRYTLKSLTAKVPVNTSPVEKLPPVSIILPFSKSKIILSFLPDPLKPVGISGLVEPFIELSFTHCLYELAYAL